MDRIIRILWYMVKMLCIFTLCVGVMSWSFFGAMDMSNLWVLANEGLSLRASVILQNGDTEDLTTCFTDNFIQSDSMMVMNPYQPYTIRSFESRVQVTYVRCWPWQNTAWATAIERIPAIDGSPTGGSAGKTPEPLPKWPAAKYKIKFIRTDDGWRIDELEFVENVEEKWQPDWLTPAPPSPSPTPKTTAAPTPGAT